MTTLYKKDSNGKLRVWKIWTTDGTITESSGLLEGKLVTHTKECKAKHIGKANEVKPYQQAILEADSKIKSKLDAGYFKTLEEAETSIVLLPMLAKSYEKEEKKIDWTSTVTQPKLDGMRCLIVINGTEEVQLLSRKGLEIKGVPHIQKEYLNISKLLVNFPVILDGELYAHGLTFQENMKLIKKYREGETEKILYHVYDMVTKGSFTSRYTELVQFVASVTPNYTELVLSFPTLSREELYEAHTRNLGAGYEGTMLRWGSEEYKLNGRSSNLLKYKDFKDLACRVVDIVPMDAYPDQGIVVAEIDDNQFKATPKMSHKQRQELLRDREEYLGRIGEFRFFEFTDDGVPRFPIFVGFREDL